MTSRVLVTGATGTLGRQVVRQIFGTGPVLRLASRRPRPDRLPEQVEWASADLGRGRDVAQAVAGVDTIVHCASDGMRARRDLPGIREFLDLAREAGVGHLVYVSIVGVDRVPLGYYQAKFAEERMIEDSGLGWTVLRATQFHDLVHAVLAGAARLPVMPLPAGTRVQPVSAGEVAGRLVELAAAAPAGRVPDFGGPQIRTVRELADTYLRVTGRRRRVLPVRVPGAVARAYRDGGHLAPDRAEGRITFEDFLVDRYG